MSRRITRVPIATLPYGQSNNDTEYNDTPTESESANIGPLIIRRRYWEQKSIISKQHKIGFFSLVSLICVFGILVLWYTGLMPGIPDGWYRYGGALFYISLIAYIIGAGVVFSERIEFYVLTAILHIGALILNAFIVAGLIYSYISCVDGTNPSTNCVYPYIIDSIMLCIVSVLSISGAITAACLMAMIWHYRRVTSYTPKRLKRV